MIHLQKKIIKPAQQLNKLIKPSNLNGIISQLFLGQGKYGNVHILYI